MGYDARGEYGIAGRRYFSKSVGTGTATGFHVHVFEIGDSQATRHIAFRDCMRLLPDLAIGLANLKRSMADPDGHLPADYAGRKASYVDLIAGIAVLQYDPTAAYELIAPYINPNTGNDDLKIAYHDQWGQALENEALRLDKNRLDMRQA